MTLRIGNDIVEIEKLTKVYNSNPEKFLSRIFNQVEIKYCLSRRNPMIHFAGKFAAKEAIKKALSSTLKATNVSFKDIIINNKQNGMPYATIRNNEDKVHKISISISHTDNYASAVAISYMDK